MTKPGTVLAVEAILHLGPSTSEEIGRAIGMPPALVSNTLRRAKNEDRYGIYVHDIQPAARSYSGGPRNIWGVKKPELLSYVKSKKIKSQINFKGALPAGAASKGGKSKTQKLLQSKTAYRSTKWTGPILTNWLSSSPFYECMMERKLSDLNICVHLGG